MLLSPVLAFAQQSGIGIQLTERKLQSKDTVIQMQVLPTVSQAPVSLSVPISGSVNDLFLPPTPYGAFCRFEDWLSGDRKWRIDLGTD